MAQIDNEWLTCLSYIQDAAASDLFHRALGIYQDYMPPDKKVRKPNPRDREYPNGTPPGVYFHRNEGHWYARVRGGWMDGADSLGAMAFDSHGLCQTYALIIHKARNEGDVPAQRVMGRLVKVDNQDRFDRNYAINAKIALTYLRALIRANYAAVRDSIRAIHGHDVHKLLYSIDVLLRLNMDMLAHVLDHKANYRKVAWNKNARYAAWLHAFQPP